MGKDEYCIGFAKLNSSFYKGGYLSFIKLDFELEEACFSYTELT